MKNLTLTDSEYDTLMDTLKAALIGEDGGPRHDEYSVLYHTLGGYHGYGKG